MPDQRTATAIDESKVEALGERILDEVNAGMSCLNLYVGHRLGLFRALRETGDVTPADLTRITGYDERYLREWLECMAANGYLDHRPETASFSLSDEHAAVLADDEHPGYASPLVCWIPSLASILPELLDAFGSGGGVPYEAYGEDTLEAVGAGNKAMFMNEYATTWLPTMPDVESRLKAGGRVADIGCGVGWSSICLAQAFPDIAIDAVDLDQESISKARNNAKASGVHDLITFHTADAEEAPLEGPYDLVTAFECIHDMAHPVAALERMRELAAEDGAALVADEAVGDGVEENRHFMGRICYNFSVLHCLPQARVFPESAATGTVMGPRKLEAYARDAGFRRMEILPIEHPIWRFYRLFP
jgi:2-polyprenyl-3-methyl-5-hydroxy-6-metoxy-1,4-benzoquinol methylase